MQRHLLLLLMFVLSACLGAECSGGGSHGSTNDSSPAQTAFEGQTEVEQLPGAPVPEPGAALVFGVGLLVAGVASRRRRRAGGPLARRQGCTE